MEDSRPVKRARQACEPCRRKKSRCPGERPTCSYCMRLGQNCVYATAEIDENQMMQNRQLESRMNSLEGKLEQVLQHLTSHTVVVEPTRTTPAISEPRRPSSPEPSRSNAMIENLSFPFESTTLVQIGTLYLKWCHRQPMELFLREGFIESLSKRDQELLLALGALSLRFPPGALDAAREEQLDTLAVKSRQLVMQRLAQGQVEQSTLQTLCLLGMIGMAAQRTSQAELDFSIASALAQSLIGQLTRPNLSLLDVDETKLSIRSIFMLHNLYGSIPRAMSFLNNPTSGLMRAVPLIDISEITSTSNDGADSMKYIAMLSEVWQLARVYAANNPDKDTVPPWTPSSDYSNVMQQHLQIDSQVPLRHRYNANRIEEYDPEDLQVRRDHWGPWLFLQFVYAAIPCLLNHPYLLSLRLTNFRQSIPHSFIQQSFEQITRHAGWICHFLDVLEEKQFATSDPTLAHCVAIIATIHLQHSFVTTDSTIRESARLGLQKCMNFLRRMGSVWQTVKTMVDDLEKLRESVVETPNFGTDDQGDDKQTWTIDAWLLRNILIYGNSSRNPSFNEHNLFGKTLVRRIDRSHEAEAEFDLVGSVGLFGHKAVPKETPLYPPNESVTPFGKDEYILQRRQGQNGLQDAIHGDAGQESFFIGAVEYGQAIESWLDSNVLY